MKTTLPLSKALALAKRIEAILSPHCELFHIAGSIRREKETVGDIEVVCLPRKVPIKEEFFEKTWIPCRDFSDGILAITKTPPLTGSFLGRYAKYIIPANKKGNTVQLDLFLPQAHDYYRQLAIRTGSADYSAKVIASAWVRKGWVGTSQGLRLADECEKKGNVWHCIAPIPTLPPAWKSEEEFFQWLGLRWVEPKERNLTSL